MRRKITLKDIARELEVSISTVSKALKNSEEIGRDTKEKVQAFAKLYNYKPNNIAVSLKNKHTKNIGVIIPDIVHYFFTTVFRGIEKYANSRGYNVIACVSYGSFDKEVINMEMLANGSIDGFIMALSSETQQKNDYNHLREVTQQGIPLVLFDSTTDEIDCDKVVINDEAAAYEAVKKMLSSGKKRIALFSTGDFYTVNKKREKGYRRALAEYNIEVDEDLILKMPPDENIDIIDPFLERNKIDAVLAVNEITAIHAMGIARKKGYRIPEDIAFIGFTDGLLSKYSQPSLTAIAQHGDQMGEIAAQMLIEKVESEYVEEEEEVFRTEIIEATLIERESTIN
ncbi:LacI family DNA-binding transcriptional regulator [Maribacter sp. 2308TA10-17]|uniref:LacI family DNA-binding transcriptional regulator n=1 Tax=Maribacter sp. 2308TA10-17 TaxID=3386276 RepID=UPI0039BCBAD6